MVSNRCLLQSVIGSLLLQAIAVGDDAWETARIAPPSFPVMAVREYDANVERLIEIVEQETPRPDAPRETVEAIIGLGHIRANLAVRTLIPWLAVRPPGGIAHSDRFDRHYLFPAAAALVEIGGPARSRLSSVTYDPEQSTMARETACWCLLEIEGNLTDEMELDWSREVVLLRMRRLLERPFYLNDDERATLQSSIDYITNYQAGAELILGPVFETWNLPNGAVGEAYCAEILIGPAPENPREQVLSIDMDIYTPLPPGLSLDREKRTIEGIPEVAGEFTFRIGATSCDAQGFNSYSNLRQYTIVIE